MKAAWVFTAGLVIKALLVCFVIAALALGGTGSLDEAAFLLALAFFFLAKAAFCWFARRRIHRLPEMPRFLANREWRHLSLIYLASGSLFLLAAILGHQETLSWVGVVASVAIGWMYFVVSLPQQVV